jgi:hypothetical protein
MTTSLRTLKSFGLAAALLLVGIVTSDAAPQRTTIPFADLGNIRDWQAANADEIYIQAMNRDWFRATFWAPCQSLPFSTGIAFVTEPNGRLDSFSSILVEGERCWFKTFERSDAPPRDAGR